MAYNDSIWYTVGVCLLLNSRFVVRNCKKVLAKELLWSFRFHITDNTPRDLAEKDLTERPSTENIHRKLTQTSLAPLSFAANDTYKE